MDGYEKLISKTREEMRDFLFKLCATDTSKCDVLCNGHFCYTTVSKRKCKQKLEEFLNRDD